MANEMHTNSYTGPRLCINKKISIVVSKQRSIVFFSHAFFFQSSAKCFVVNVAYRRQITPITAENVEQQLKARRQEK